MNFIKKDLEILAKTIYGEARGEVLQYGISALIAVANVIINRKRKGFARTIAEVCLAPYQFSCWNVNDPNYEKIYNNIPCNTAFNRCMEVSERLLREEWPDLTDGCDHYHAKSIKPYWALHLYPKKIIGSHCFYSLRDDRIR